MLRLREPDVEVAGTAHDLERALAAQARAAARASSSTSPSASAGRSPSSMRSGRTARSSRPRDAVTLGYADEVLDGGRPARAGRRDRVGPRGRATPRSRDGRVLCLTQMGLGAHWWQYTLLFVAVTASWAGVPMIGAAAAAAAGAAASQGTLSLLDVVVVTTVAGEVGGLLGYAIGSHWGRALLGRPGRHLEARQRILEKGERAYARWGRLAVFFTPAIVSGTAKMQRGQFALWNLLASARVRHLGLRERLRDRSRAHRATSARTTSARLVVGLVAGGALVWVARTPATARRGQHAV